MQYGNDTCFYVSTTALYAHYGSNATNYAQIECAKIGATVAEIKTPAEREAVIHLTSKQ